MDKAVSAVFAALIWHTQEIRQDLTPFGMMSLLHHHNKRHVKLLDFVYNRSLC